MPANYVLIREVTLNASAASVTLSSIPSGYTDLCIKLSTRNNAGGIYESFRIDLNGSSASFTEKGLYGLGSGGTGSESNSNPLFANGSGSTTNTFSNSEVYIPNYTASQNKSMCIDTVVESNAASGPIIYLASGLWSNTAAVTSITFAFSSANSFAAGSSFSVYGVASLNATPTVIPAASGGDIVTNDGTYWYHAFLASGTFIPNKNLSCDVLVVAGGGGGGSNGGGGGGAGGVIANAAASFTSNTIYSASIGAGGGAGVNGSNTIFGSYTAIGGGKGGPFNQAGTSGGNGGGGAMSAGGTVTGGSSTQTGGYGFAGGNGSSSYSSSTGGGGGGGGASSAGGNAVNANPMLGTGGTGISGTVLSFINSMGSATSTGQLSGGNYYYAGGGSGGPSGHSVSYGGLGGGGNFNTAATINTGGGGGAGQAYGTDSPAAGGSGIVIIRYAMV